MHIIEILMYGIGAVVTVLGVMAMVAMVQD